MNAIETLRKTVITHLMSLDTVSNAWPSWQSQIQSVFDPSRMNSREICILGNNLYEIFKSTSSGRDQSGVAAGGAAWEGLICWYLNLCLIGSRTVVIKAKKSNIPQCISDAISVNYGNFPSNTESDLLAITFPQSEKLLEGFSGNHEALMRLINNQTEREFTSTELAVIQCKTNWNDNAQIPMLWDLVYASRGFGSVATVGRFGFSHTKLQKFSYSFVTVPTVKPDKFKPSSTAVMRVKSLSGGNYWGLPSKNGIASNIFDILQKNFSTSINEYPNGWHREIVAHIDSMKVSDNYFNL